MQYLKEEIRNSIISAALEEFNKKGFLEASMRVIAKNAGVALGNVYRYFKNKEELFNQIMEPVYSAYTTLISNLARTSVQSLNAEKILPTRHILNEIMKVYNTNGTELLIMIDKSKGSKYQNSKQDLIDLIDDQLKKLSIPNLIENGITLEDEFITYVISASFIEGVFIVLRKYNDKSRIEYLLNQMILIFFNDIADRLK